MAGFGIGMNFGDDRVGEMVVIDLPTDGSAAGQGLGTDLDLVASVVAAETSRLLVSLRDCVNSAAPEIELDNQAGLLRVSGVSSPTAAQGSVTWAADSVTIHIDAAAFKHLKPGSYALALEEITVGGRRLHKHSREILLYRTGGGLR